MSRTIEPVTSCFVATNLRTGTELRLTLQELVLTGEILPVGARLRVRHTFRSAEPQTVEAVYAFPLPRDAALKGFRILAQDFQVESELRPTKKAVEEYEDALLSGHLAALARQYRDGLINLSLGNLRPDETVVVFLDILAGVELHDRGLRFRFPFTLAPCYHSQARAVAVASGIGEMELPESFGDVLLPPWVHDAHQLHAVGFELRVRVPSTQLEIGSPSHAITVSCEEGGYRVRLAREKDVPNRDLILDVRTAANGPTITGGVSENKKAYFAVVVPSTLFGKPNGAETKQVVFVLDRSGSMTGQPLRQAKQALKACLGAMSDQDWFNIVAFDHSVESLSPKLLQADATGRQRANQFLDQIEARGGTELAKGVLAAAQMVKKHGGSILVVTDGQVFGTETILQQVRERGIRLHCLGIGSASQDRFLALLARETGGTSRFLAPRERVDVAALELFAAMGSPLASDLELQVQAGNHVRLVTPPPRHVFAGSPVLLLLEADSSAEIRVLLQWRIGAQKQCHEFLLPCQPNSDAETIRLIQGARRITDLEAQLEEVPGSLAGSADRCTKRITKALERLSQEYGLASRVMSLVAVLKRKGDVLGGLPKTIAVPVGMPEDVAFEAYFSRAAMMPGSAGADVLALSILPKPQRSNAEPVLELMLQKDYQQFRAEEHTNSEMDLLFELAARMESDGGLPGKSDEERWLATVIALGCFRSAGHSSDSGPFRQHLQRLEKYLDDSPLTVSDPLKQQLVEQLKQGNVPNIPWQDFARKILAGKRIPETEFWKSVHEAI